MYIDTALTPQEVADILKISKSTVYELIRRKEINSYRVGKKVRVDLKDVEAYKNKTKNIKTISNDFTNTSGIMTSNTVFQSKDTLEKYSFVISGQDAILDILCRYLACYEEGMRALRSYEGSYNGIYALYCGKVQAATAHMWDGETKEYNVPYIKKMLPGTPAVIIRLVGRMTGFYVAKGNPKRIKDWNDFRRQDITMINREKGSGTRILLDEHLRQMNILGNQIKGYSRECVSHLAVASIVARGGADLGMGNEKSCSQVDGVDFVPIKEEKYDMVIKKEDINKPSTKAIMDILSSEEFRMEIQGIGGYNISEMGKIIAET
ncbi:substrate-binding domain-containing protein [Clostridium luticellarii]|jgi:putative molybdopterin biosynthesis protein|uniref:PBP superfamily domain protein n=1 Tax=Clostridium luticellarii TaxID=1691940 RepID=A0A2T0B3B7_9CLOT|nr:helix-turn-helix transcriptional regulator [Clostridium luticellarii]MCI1945717.1 helix-turn-helix transcriptional regulator [Clostridium luticellarii]MCI1969076.1 helix-turn-helix transcriptional regulator [Clostridium luticellarii]MCI1996088.1 helix-turn-helix transcriptional regulator [Clostridium luticellarii]MCI2040425.1 helix-turn-helix transcriptional regulator [Clostridium luticellarii]PRR78388.1 PBP superfamily domain protein [Clostridium luticellarii]